MPTLPSGCQECPSQRRDRTGRGRNVAQLVGHGHAADRVPVADGHVEPRAVGALIGIHVHGRARLRAVARPHRERRHCTPGKQRREPQRLQPLRQFLEPDGSQRRSATLTALSVGVVGGVSGAASINSSNGIKTGIGRVSDPYTYDSYPTFSGCSQTNFPGKNTATIDPGV
jgi:hypothetical protein